MRIGQLMEERGGGLMEDRVGHGRCNFDQWRQDEPSLMVPRVRNDQVGFLDYSISIKEQIEVN